MPQTQQSSRSTLLTQGFGDRIARTAEKMQKEGAKYGIDDVAGNFKKGDYKCNKFVYDVLNATGIDAPSYPGGQWPYQAKVWGNPKFNMPGWIIVEASQVRPGDVVAQKRGYDDATGHVGIVLGPGRTLAAHNEGLGIDRFGFENDPKYSEPIVFRRYVGRGRVQ